jgi:transposase
MTKPLFKTYQQRQPMLLPPNIDDLIPTGHLVRVVSELVDGIKSETLESQYKGGGTTAFHPKMLLKVILYNYTQKVFSSRQIAKSLRENINCMWLSGMNQPDHRTINRFRGQIMTKVIEEVFTLVLEQLEERGYIKLENYFYDGTKIEANANKYSFVWKKSTQKNKAKLQEKVRTLLKEIDEIEAAEEKEYGDKDLEEVGEGKEISAEDLQEAVDRINRLLEKEPKNKELKKTKKDLEKDYIPREKKYEQQEKLFKGRNSYSKTDNDATFMRMKEDHMRNGQLKAGYNVQIGTENQFITGYSLHQRPGDPGCLPSHLEKVRDLWGKLPVNVIADAGYGSEENYAYMESNQITSFVKYNTFHYEAKKKGIKARKYHLENFKYLADENKYVCPEGKALEYIRTISQKTENGYRSFRDVYECQVCDECPVKPLCTKAAGNRAIAVGSNLLRLKKEAHDRLISEKGKELRSKRPVEVEAVFGRLKHNWGFRRFLLRGLEKVNTEWGILCIAHNMAKVAAR